MTMKEKMQCGELYLCEDPEIVEEQRLCLEKLYDFNQTRPSELARRTAELYKRRVETGEGGEHYAAQVLAQVLAER